MAFVAWLISGKIFVGEADFRVVYYQVPICLEGILPGGFFPGDFYQVAYFLDPYHRRAPKLSPTAHNITKTM